MFDNSGTMDTHWLKTWKEVANLSHYTIKKALFYFYSIGIVGNRFKENNQSVYAYAHYKLTFIRFTEGLKDFFIKVKKVYKSRLESKDIVQIIKQGSRDYYHKFYL